MLENLHKINREMHKLRNKLKCKKVLSIPYVYKSPFRNQSKQIQDQLLLHIIYILIYNINDMCSLYDCISRRFSLPSIRKKHQPSTNDAIRSVTTKNLRTYTNGMRWKIDQSKEKWDDQRYYFYPHETSRLWQKRRENCQSPADQAKASFFKPGRWGILYNCIMFLTSWVKKWKGHIVPVKGSRSPSSALDNSCFSPLRPIVFDSRGRQWLYVHERVWWWLDRMFYR